jgi:hypothetical protein
MDTVRTISQSIKRQRESSVVVWEYCFYPSDPPLKKEFTFLDDADDVACELVQSHHSDIQFYPNEDVILVRRFGETTWQQFRVKIVTRYEYTAEIEK